MTKATPAGRTLTDPPAVPGGNPKYRESGQVSRPAACTTNAPGREPAGRFLFGADLNRTRLFVAAAIVLIAGLLSAAAIYFSADDEPDLSTSYVVVIDPTATKTYVRELRRFGGQAAVLFDEFNRWFAGLWHGKALGITIAWISVAAAVVIFWIARRMPKQKS